MSGVVKKGMISLVLACACALAGGARLDAQKVIATIPVGDFVGGGAVDPGAKLAYIPIGHPNGANGQVAVINEQNNNIVRTINLATPWGAVSAALDPFTGLLYVGTQAGGLFVVDAKTGVTQTVVNVNAVSVAMNPVTNKIYASDFNSTLYVIDGATNNIETTISINAIQNITVNPFTNRIYAAVENYVSGGVAVVDGASNQVIAQPTAGSGLSFAVAVDPAKNAFYSAELFGTATAYDGKTNQQVKAIPLVGQPSGIADDPFTHTVFVSNYQTNSVDLINGSTYAVAGEVPVGLQPEYLTDDPANKVLYVGCQGPNDANGFPTFVIYVVKTK